MHGIVTGAGCCDASHVAVEFVHPITAGRPALAAINLVADLASKRSKSETPAELHTTASPSIVAEVTGSEPSAAAIAGTRSVQSCPRRVNARTRSPSRRQMNR